MLHEQMGFDPEGTFYPLIVGYLAQVHGFVELASRGLRHHLDTLSKEDIRQWLERVDGTQQARALRRVGEGGITTLVSPIVLSSQTNEPVAIDSDALSAELFWRHNEPIKSFNLASAGALLILAWESTKELHDASELWQFLRHCRNAAAHNGRFTFRPKEPRHPAKWGDLEISKNLEATPLFVDPPDAGFMGLGDVVYLLAHIEAAYPRLRGAN